MTPSHCAEECSSHLPAGGFRQGQERFAPGRRPALPFRGNSGNGDNILKEPFQLPPLFLGRPAEASREPDSNFFSRPRVLFWRGQIFEELADEFGAHALVQQRQIGRAHV